MENQFHSFRFIIFVGCPKLLNLICLVFTPYLEILYVGKCKSIEHLISCSAYGVDENLDVFLRLKYFKLNMMPRLKSIYQHPLRFPLFEVINVYDCKSLKILSFNFSPSSCNFKKIKGETGWWNQLE